MSVVNEKINYHLLALGRQARGLSQKELAERTGLVQGQISKFENGISEPSIDAVNLISNALRFPLSFFMQNDRPGGYPVSIHSMHRKKAATPKKDLDKIYGEIYIRIMHLRRLLQSVEIEENYKLPQWDVEEYGNPSRIADLLRRLWNVPPGPVENITALLEGAGIIVIECRFPTKDVDGISLTPPGLRPCVFIRNDQPADRRRFSLAHELGHLIMHTMPAPDMEKEANAFAAEFLMPADDIRPYFSSGITLQKLAGLKPIWKVAMAALLMRAQDLKMVDDNKKVYLWQQFSRQGLRKQEPVYTEFPSECSILLNDVIEAHTKKLGYSKEQLSTLLNIYPDDFDLMYNFVNKTKPRLSIVRH